jgi:hypothetical protein
VQPSRTPLIVGALVVVIALLGVAVYFTFRSPPIDTTVVATDVKVDPTPTPTPPVPVVEKPPLSAAVKLTLESTPAHVEVYEEDVLLGATPLTISRPPGTVTSLRFEAKGFQPLSRKVRFESDTTLPLQLEKEVAKGKKPGKPRPPNEGDLMDLPE